MGEKEGEREKRRRWGMLASLRIEIPTTNCHVQKFQFLASSTASSSGRKLSDQIFKFFFFKKK